ncbi:virulence RhuM family protein [Desulfonatronovibrio magnus]|uniref:virulence RhuM family protein n=1 Tax=Desulfonatronovibrio magnus TaxID=698827 RepID=UPI001E2E392A|nr:RhuM family protein [Desulfonatronovibrio magnus]
MNKTMDHTENTEERRMATKDELTDFFLYTAPDGQVKVECIVHDETIWLTQKRIAELFGVGVPAISKHLDNIYADGELVREATVSILETVQQEGSRQVKRNLEFYNLDAIISVGYRVNSSKATQFRILEGYGSVSRKQAEAKAFAEYDKFNKTQRIESDFDKAIKQVESSNRTGG